MKKFLFPALYFLVLALAACSPSAEKYPNIVTADIDRFWQAYDRITETADSAKQRKILKEAYFEPGTPGLASIRQARNYTADDYLVAIRQYPKFWHSVRGNTLKAKGMAKDLQAGLERLRILYPDLKPAKIYFTVGAFRTGGTARDGAVLIGSELALADKNAVSEEFPENMRGLRAFFDENPIEGAVLLCMHEYVHTQQKPLVYNLLSQSLYEGVAEFVSTRALGEPSALPAILFGQENGAVKEKFEREMFYGNNRHEWLWSQAENDFGVRDLGYYIGYALCAAHEAQAADKAAAIKKMVELDYENEAEVEAFVDGTGFFGQSLERLYQNFEAQRPRVTRMAPFPNGSEGVRPGKTTLTLTFSEPLNGYNTGVDFGPLGKEFIPRISPDRPWSADARSWSFEADLEPGRHYQILISNNFRTEDGRPLKPYLVEFRTAGP